jgi:hypothetical protein
MTSLVRVGEVLAGKYQVERVLETISAAATHAPAKAPSSTPTKTTAPDPKTLFGERK